MKLSQLKKCILILPLGLFVVGCSPVTPKDPDEIGAYVQCKDAVSERLKAPSTAEFSAYSATSVTKTKMSLKTGGDKEITFVVNGSVDAQNSFGAMLRNHYQCSVSGRTGGYWSVIAVSINE
ncbi:MULTISPECIES: hypothetical protein [Shewanella]|uniref:hypothetical protein n=1 Tax=Shewanella TaxID=22 RepID=UPI0008498543|nr:MULTISPECIES: hypothetical protein [Shewanella]ODR84937.1 hypothetical protein ABT47_06200 [Shewanella xiamenensis]